MTAPVPSTASPAVALTAAPTAGPPRAAAPPKPVVTKYTLYQVGTGKIIGAMSTSGGGSCKSATTDEILGTFDSAKYYVDITATPPSAKERPALAIAVDKTAISANGTDAANFSGIPAGATVSIDGGVPQAVPAGMLTFNATVAGSYTILFRLFPNADQSFTVVAS